MNIPEFLDLAAEIEVNVSDLYNAIVANTSDQPIAHQLKKLANEEMKHANILRTGKSYYQSMPDLFTGLTMDETEAQEGLKKAEEYLVQFRKERLPILSQLKVMLDYEKRFEKIHMETSVKIKDEKLKELFYKLGKGDQSHVVVLGALIDMLRDKA